MILDIQFAELQRITILKEEQEKSVNITENGTTEITPDKGKALSMVTVNVDVPDTSEEIGKTIDESGVLDSTEGTATEKVEQLIDKAQWEKLLYEQSGKWTENFKSMFNQFNGKKTSPP